MKPVAPNPLSPWSRLVRAARSADEGASLEAPFGFATRVASLGLAAREEAPGLVEAFALRALMLAGLVATLAVVLNLGDFFAPGADDLFAANDTVSVVLALVD